MPRDGRKGGRREETPVPVTMEPRSGNSDREYRYFTPEESRWHNAVLQAVYRFLQHEGGTLKVRADNGEWVELTTEMLVTEHIFDNIIDAVNTKKRIEQRLADAQAQISHLDARIKFEQEQAHRLAISATQRIAAEPTVIEDEMSFSAHDDATDPTGDTCVHRFMVIKRGQVQCVARCTSKKQPDSAYCIAHDPVLAEKAQRTAAQVAERKAKVASASTPAVVAAAAAPKPAPQGDYAAAAAASPKPKPAPSCTATDDYPTPQAAAAVATKKGKKHAPAPSPAPAPAPSAEKAAEVARGSEME